MKILDLGESFGLRCQGKNVWVWDLCCGSWGFGSRATIEVCWFMDLGFGFGLLGDFLDMTSKFCLKV